MAKRQKFTINGEVFTTKSALSERIKGILWAYSDGETINEHDFLFMASVFPMHHNSEIKIGCGIAAICVRKNPVYQNTRGFWIIRRDGTETDISYLECLTETPRRKRFERACRVAVEPYTMAFKQNFFDSLPNGTGTCPYTGEPITFVGSHVDHRSPMTFQRLLNDFIREYNIDPDTIKLNDAATDGIIQDRIDDQAIEQSWVNYHNKNAELQVISKSANLGIVRRLD